MAADDIYDLVERAMEYAFEGKYLLNFYALLEGKKAVKREADEFIKSSTADELRQSIQELSGYIKGGDVVLKEAYGHIPKPQARKIRTYLTKILDDALLQSQCILVRRQHRTGNLYIASSCTLVTAQG